MDKPLRFHPSVEYDLEESFLWYESRSPRLGLRFFHAVDNRFDAIAMAPDQFGIAFDDVRFAKLRKFPHLVLFRISSAAIDVAGVFHAASDPAKWRGRLP